MSCPYPDCDAQLVFSVARCERCRRPLANCLACGEPNRRLAQYCRACGEPLVEAEGQWTGFRGGPERNGAHGRPGALALPREFVPRFAPIELGDPCRSLLSWDGLFLAFSATGRVVMFEPETGKILSDVRVPEITAEPTIAAGLLYLASQGAVSVYSLAGWLLERPRLEPLNRLELPGTPAHDLLVLESHLFLRLGERNGEPAIHVVSGLGGLDAAPPQRQRLLGANKFSRLAADRTRRLVIFLSESAQGIELHRVAFDREGTSRRKESRRTWRFDSRVVFGAPRPLSSLASIAWVEGQLYAILGEADQLCRLDVDSSLVSAILAEDVSSFSLAQEREGVIVRLREINLPGAGQRNELGPHERVISQPPPFFLRGCAAAVPFSDGCLRLYELGHASRYRELHLLGASGTLYQELRAAAASGTHLAVGNRDGQVQVFDLASSAVSVAAA